MKYINRISIEICAAEKLYIIVPCQEYIIQYPTPFNGNGTQNLIGKYLSSEFCISGNIKNNEDVINSHASKLNSNLLNRLID